jgi:hypothetical protein
VKLVVVRILKDRRPPPGELFDPFKMQQLAWMRSPPAAFFDYISTWLMFPTTVTARPGGGRIHIYRQLVQVFRFSILQLEMRNCFQSSPEGGRRSFKIASQALL